MMNKFSVLLLPLLFFSLLSAAGPGEGPYGSDAESSVVRRGKEVDRKSYPDADNVLLYEKERYSYDASGVCTTRDEMYVKVLTEAGRRELRKLSFRFNTHYNRIKVEEIAVIKPGGERERVDVAKNSRVVIDASQMAGNIYDPASRRLTVSIPRLEVGDILHVRTTNEHFKPRIKGFWSCWTLLQADWPIVENLIEIDAPASLPLRSIALKGEVKGTVKHSARKEGDRILYRWHARNVPQVIREPGMPELHTCVQRLLVSTAASWEEISRWYWNLCRPRLDAVTPAMRQFVDSLVKGKKSDMEKIKAIFHFVSQEIRYMGITPEKETPGYEPHDVKMTFERRYGVCRDKAALLVSLLELAGFKAFPVLFMAGDPKDEEIPNDYFNHAVTAVELGKDNFLLMDPTYESTSEFFPAFQSDMSYLVAHPEGRKLRRSPVVPAERNRVSIRTESKLRADDTLSGTTEIELSGVNDVYYRSAFSRWSPEQRTEFFLNRLRLAMPGALLDELRVQPENIRDMSQGLKFFMRYSVSVHSAPNEWLVEMPGLAGAFGVGEVLFGDVRLLSRKYPLKLPATCLVEEAYTVELPSTCRIMALPRSEKFGVGEKLLWDLSTAVKGNLVTVKKRFAVNALEITPAEYPALKSALSRLDAFRAALPLAENDYRLGKTESYRKAFPGADSVIENFTTAIDLKDGSRWQVKERIRRRILSYAGVKAHSEVKISYVPEWESVSVTAKVTGPDGKVRSLGKNEINIMDSPRNGSGPRYPAGKILVASLPGVTAGCVIELEIERECRNRNSFHAEVPFFSTSAPIIRRRLEVRSPEELHLRSSLRGEGIFYREWREGKQRVRIWSSEDIPRMKKESSLPPRRFFAPGVQLSSGENKSWAAALNAALMAKCNASLAVARRLAAEQKWDQLQEPAEAVRAIRDYVDKNIRKCDIPLNEIPLSALSSAEVTLSSGYGNSADRAILIGALLKSVGCEFAFRGVGEIGYSVESSRSFEQVPAPGAFVTGVLVYVPALKWHLNDTGRYAAPGAVNSEYLLGLDLRSGRIINIQPPAMMESSKHLLFRIVCKPDLSADVSVEERLTGHEYETVKRELETATPERRRRFFEERIGAISHGSSHVGPGFSDFRAHPGILRYKFNAKGLISGIGDYRVLTLPRYRLLRENGTIPANPDRTLPYWRNRQKMLKLDYVIVPPPGFQAVPGRPERVEIGRYGSARYTENYSASPSQIVLRCRNFLPVEMVSALDYCELENRQRILSRPGARRIIMKKISAGKR